MTALRSVVIAFACFSSIPMPHVEWNERNMRYLMAAFPLVGVFIGACLALWQRLCGLLGVGTALRGAGLALIPILVTGGIHMDGFADVTDALSSHAAPERKREILKDPHVGAFAVIGIGCYLLASFALCCELDAKSVGLIACTPAISRCLAGIAAVSSRLSSNKGMLASMSGAAHTRTVRAVLAATLLAATGAMACLSVPAAMAALAGAGAVVAWVARLARREFGGMSGDLSGFTVQAAELVMLACVVFAEKVW